MSDHDPEDFAMPARPDATHEEKAIHVFSQSMRGAQAIGAQVSASCSVGADGRAQIFFYCPQGDQGAFLQMLGAIRLLEHYVIDLNNIALRKAAVAGSN